MHVFIPESLGVNKSVSSLLCVSVSVCPCQCGLAIDLHKSPFVPQIYKLVFTSWLLKPCACQIFSVYIVALASLDCVYKCVYKEKN